MNTMRNIQKFAKRRMVYNYFVDNNLRILSIKDDNPKNYTHPLWVVADGLFPNWLNNRKRVGLITAKEIKERKQIMRQDFYKDIKKSFRSVKPGLEKYFNCPCLYEMVSANRPVAISFDPEFNQCLVEDRLFRIHLVSRYITGVDNTIEHRKLLGDQEFTPDILNGILKFLVDKATETGVGLTALNQSMSSRSMKLIRNKNKKK